MGRKKKLEVENNVETIDVAKVGKNAGEMLEKELQDEKKSDPEPSRKTKAAPPVSCKI